MCSAVYFAQGIESLPAQGLFYYFKESLNFTAERIMLLNTIIISAWLIKPIIGYIIDNFLDKRTWIFLALAVDIIFVSIIGIFSLPVVFLITILFLNSTNSAFRDVSVDGIMCVEGKKYGLTGKMQSVQWISIMIALLLTGVGGGVMAEKWGYKAAFLSLIPFYILVAIVACFYKQEKAASKGASFGNLIYELKVLFGNKKLLIICLFIFLYRYSPSFGTPLLFIQRDTFHWSKTLIGVLSSVSTLSGILGALLYYKVSQVINIKKWLYISVFLGAITSLSYLYYTPATAYIYEVVYGFIGMFIFLMVMDFMARNTISGLEATSFALLCSVSNLAMVLSTYSGAKLLPIFGLKWLIVISAATSFICLPLIKRI